MYEIIIPLLLLISGLNAWDTYGRPVNSVMPVSEEDLKKLDDFIENLLHCRRIPGLSFSVLTSHRTLLKKGYGLADVASHTAVHPTNTIFPIASNTKSFTATLLVILLENHPKNYTFDTPVVKILGDDFALYDDLLTCETTLRDLLAHKTGVPEYFLPIMAGFPADEAKTETIRRLRHHKPSAKFRTKFLYNNYMYALAGHVAEVLGGGKKWEDLISERIFEPLGMWSSTFAQSFEDWDTLATPYVLYGDEIREVEKRIIRQTNAVGPAGSILSNLPDMAEWAGFHLRRGLTSSGKRLVTEEALSALYQPEMSDPEPMSERDLYRPQFPIGDVLVSYNLGWITNVYRGYKRLWHSGGVSTYKSQIWLYPDLDIGLYAAVNGPPNSGTTWGLTLLLMYASDIFLGDEPWLNHTTACSFPAPWGQDKDDPKTSADPLPNDSLPHPQQYYVASYVAPGFGRFNVTYDEESDHLVFKMGEMMEGILQYDSSNHVFHLNLTGDLWFMPMHMPISFKNAEGSGRANAYLPVVPSATADPVVFYREGQEPTLEDQPRPGRCSSGASVTMTLMSYLREYIVLLLLTVALVMISVRL